MHKIKAYPIHRLIHLFVPLMAFLGRKFMADQIQAEEEFSETILGPFTFFLDPIHL